ncbi:MAG TPA: SDR family oxidoreductase [Actinomycetes bacterium]|nr:SDR family oxidoreductase [Actinomycetes bacterium]
METTVAVTGATGNVGGRVARHLADAGVRQRLLVRDPSRAPELPNATVAQSAYDDAAATQAALEGIVTVFMVSAAESVDRVQQHRTFIDAAAAAGVANVVYTSLCGAAPDATFTLARDHWATEEHIKQASMRWTFLRDNLYADFLPKTVSDGMIRGPAGDGRAAVVAIDDVADVASAVLLNPSPHAGNTYYLTGPQSLSLDEVAAIISEASGSAVTYHPETLDEAYESRRHYGAPDWMVDAWVSTYTAVAAGEYAQVTDDVQRITGHPPRSLKQVLAS